MHIPQLLQSYNLGIISCGKPPLLVSIKGYDAVQQAILHAKI